jgi:hypothetical protein
MPAASYPDNDRASANLITPVPDARVVAGPPEAQRDNNTVNPFEIGQAGNAFGFAFNRTTYLWADNNINAVTFTHRMVTPPGTGYLAYDISKDGGLSWTSNIQAYDPTLPDGYDARYPQGAIYNPAGNTNPDNAYFHFFAPTLDGSNAGGSPATDWGGYAYGVKNLADGGAGAQHNRTTTPPYYQYLPSAFTITQTGDAWMVDENTLGDAAGYTYQGSITIGHGIWDNDLNDYNYTFDQIPLEVATGDGINDIKIAFAPDGMTGYICVMTNLPDVLPYTSYHPVLYKTTDGGESWSDPIEVQLGGQYGLEPVQQFITDEILTSFFDPDPVPPRNEIDYYMGYECDLSVDAWGNPHIIGMCCIADNAQGLIYTSTGLIAMFHIWSDDQGDNWNAFNLGNLTQFSATFGTDPSSIIMYNRPQVATTMDGAIVFFSWLDSENPDLTDNSQPDIFFREYLPTLGQHGDAPVNVTTFSAGMWSSFYGCMSHYVFSQVSETGYICTIPFAYEQMTNNDPALPVKFYYIPDFERTYTITGIEGERPLASAVVSQNYPNPFSKETSVKINLVRDANIKLDIYNITGSIVSQRDFGVMTKGVHELKISAEGLSRGVYFYTVYYGTGKVTKKMIIQ